MKYRDVERILLGNGFELARTGKTSHRQYKRFFEGRTYLVTLAFHGANEDVGPKNLSSIIRTSGLLKSLFRK